MKFNRVFSTFVLVGLLSGATMVAQAQTRLFFGFGGGRAPVVSAQYYSPGPGYVWIAGYYNGPYWVPGHWMRRDDDDGYYGGYYGRSYYGGYYGNGFYGRGYYRGDDRRWRRDDDRRDRHWSDRGWRRGGDRHDTGRRRGRRRHDR